MTRSRVLVLVVVALVIGIAVVAVTLRQRLRCVGFAGSEVTVAELPPPRDGAEVVRVAHFNLRNFPLDERPETPELGFARRTNICDLEATLSGLDAQVLGFAEVCDTRRFPPILRRSCDGRDMRILFSQDGGRGGQHLAVAWDGGAFELVEGPLEIDELVVKPGLRPGLAVRLRSIVEPALDFTVIEVHLDSGVDDLEHRLTQIGLLADWIDDLVRRTGDPDVVLLGDFNTMGGTDISPLEELGLTDALLAGAGLDRLENASGCTEYWDGPGDPDGIFHPSLLDLVYLGGVGARGPARSWLHCARLRCGELVSRIGAEDGTFFDVSDHCPVTVEIVSGEL